jgi:hypothetical protein
MATTLYETVVEIQAELDLHLCSKQRRKYLECELDRYLAYQEAHPTAEKTPTSFQLYCFENPEAVECRVFDV